ncbi:MAG: hypothetical protein LQ339_005822 [Xanthoria mediterranea]|nr:MAG: hypothetical protein LQ339_005822 [Xanthoria mediterranea]
MAAKVLKMKLWPDDAGGTKGSKPDFHGAAGGEQARELYDHFVTKVEGMYEKEKVKNGVFQAMMQVNLQNDGPVSVDYQSYDAEVIETISLLCLHLHDPLTGIDQPGDIRDPDTPVEHTGQG